MVEQKERLWDFDAVQPGQAGQPTVVTITAENIAGYALAAQNRDARYHRGGANAEYDGEGPRKETCGGGRSECLAMPSMVLSYAPLLRDDIAANNGFTALEESRTARRQTPFAKCEIRWSRPVRAGDTITGNRRVLEKYQRRGNKFVTFRVEAVNQRGELVAEYDYTCIFEYAQGQREVPRDRGTAQPDPLDAGSVVADAATPPLFPTFDSTSVGGQLATLDISESEAIILRKNEFRLAGEYHASNIHTDEEFARRNIFGGAVNSGPATMSYVDQMLARSFPLRAFYNGGKLLMRAITPFRSGDTVTFQGEVTSMREEGRQGIVGCRVRGTNQRGDLVCLADAVMVMPE